MSYSCFVMYKWYQDTQDYVISLLHGEKKGSLTALKNIRNT